MFSSCQKAITCDPVTQVYRLFVFKYSVNCTIFMTPNKDRTCVKPRCEIRSTVAEVCTNVNVCVPSGEVMVEERGVPVQDEWSMAPDEERVRFSLSGVTPLWKRWSAAEEKELKPPCTNIHAHKKASFFHIFTSC